MSTSRWLEERSRTFVLALGVVLTLLLGVLDFGTGWELSFSVFYVAPVAMVAWYAGRGLGMAIGVLSALVWLAANQLAGEPFTHPLIPVWNALVRLTFFVVIVLTLTAQRRTLTALRAALEGAEQSARVDSLTGIRNSRAFYEIAEQEVVRAARYERPLTLAYIDADGFKAVNDQLGHSAGDRVLRAIAQALSAGLRTTDIVARLGGDEFGVLLPETGVEASRSAIEKLQAELDAAMAREGVAVTFCVGAVTASSPARTVDELVQRADALMYDAKRAGRNAIRTAVLIAPTVPAALSAPSAAGRRAPRS